MKPLKIILFCLFSCILLVCCQKEKEPPSEAPSIPESYLKLLNANRNGLTYLTSSSISSATKVFFTDGSSIIVPTSDLVINDCTTGNPLTVSYQADKSCWMVGSQESLIKRSNLAAEKSLPLYAYYDMRYLKIYVCNGDVIEFDNGYVEKEEPPKYKIPSIYLTTDGNAPIQSKEEYVIGAIKVIDSACFYSQMQTYEGRMKIRGRGNSTWNMPKKPFKIKLEEKARLFGMSTDKEWVLMANYSDKTLLRNMVAMEISRICGMSWTPKMISAEIYLNGKYQGCYNFGEHKKVSEERVHIETVKSGDNNGEALTGGYYLEIEEAMDQPVCFKTGLDVPMMFQKPENPSTAQLSYVRQLFSDFEKALDAISGQKDYTSYTKYIDVPSFVNYLIIQEVVKNPDGNVRKSTFLTKERGKKLEMYHVWDFDLTLGNCNYLGDIGPTGWQIKDGVWYNKLMKDPEFVRLFQQKWDTIKPSLDQIPDFIDYQVFLMDGAQDRNFVEWQILNKYVWPNCVVLGSYDKEVEYMKDFHKKRVAWLDKAIRELMTE